MSRNQVRRFATVFRLACLSFTDIICCLKIDKWDNMYNEIDQMESHQIFNKWLRLDVTNFKQALLNECCKWGNVFKQQLIQFLNYNLNVRMM